MAGAFPAGNPVFKPSEQLLKPSIGPALAHHRRSEHPCGIQGNSRCLRHHGERVELRTKKPSGMAHEHSPDLALTLPLTNPEAVPCVPGCVPGLQTGQRQP